ncbi:MAG: 2,3-bisphosphoglycerate-independent phosphoglycerate mutase [Gemmatimonadota bacterium]|nr:2,3-bisphosphoglycerate-independent phosphoglycerate mutase [Gemmatimonadota bacterium]
MSNGSGRRSPVALIVLDGWGHRSEREGNAIALGQTPTWRRLWSLPSRTLLDASGLAVGLPEGQMGNSEVGHLNLGAGRVVPQDLVRISESVRSGAFFGIESLVQLTDQLRRTGGTLHLVGLLGEGGVHAIDEHLLAAVALGVRREVPRIAVHGFLDGRDTLPRIGDQVVAKLQADLTRIAGPRAVIATLTGRYFAMDRDRRWERIRLAYDAMVHGVGAPSTDPVAAVRQAFERGETDEFIKPIVLQRDGGPVASIRAGDGIFFVNYRSDRMRQIVRALTVDGFDGFTVPGRPAVTCVTMTQYDQTFPIPVAFAPFSMARIMAEVLQDAERTQFRTAETEKYPHVTYFFNGGHEPPYRGEERCLVPSQKVATYDLAPEMSADGIADALVGAMHGKEHDFFLCNFANADMVGHTGVFPAVLKAVATVDRCLGRIVAAAEATGTRLLITADHGNAEMMLDPATGGPHTAHTTNPVPLVAVGTEFARLRSGGALCDVAPTILALLGLPQPSDMTGTSLAAVAGSH